MSGPWRTGTDLRLESGVGFAAGAAAAALVVASPARGPLALALCVGALVTLVAARSGVLGLAALTGILLLVEDDRGGGTPPNFPGLYGGIHRLPGLRVTDLLVLLLALGAGYSLLRESR